MTEMIEEKPKETEQDLFDLRSGEMSAAEMEKSMAETIDKLMAKEHAWATAELTGRERVILKVLQNRQRTFKIGTYDEWVQEYLELSVPYKRQRTAEMVKIFEGAMQYIKVSLKEKAANLISQGI